MVPPGPVPQGYAPACARGHPSRPPGRCGKLERSFDRTARPRTCARPLFGQGKAAARELLRCPCSGRRRGRRCPAVAKMVDGVGQEHENGAGGGEEKEHPPVRPSRSGQRPSSAAIVGTVTSSSGCARTRHPARRRTKREGRPRGTARVPHVLLNRPRIAAGRVLWQGGRRGRVGAGGSRGAPDPGQGAAWTVRNRPVPDRAAVPPSGSKNLTAEIEVRRSGVTACPAESHSRSAGM
jgi:hypothetical protein